MTALGAGEQRGEQHLLLIAIVYMRHQSQSFCQLDGSLEAFCQTLLQPGFDLQSVYDDIDRVLLVFFEFRRIVNLAYQTINTGADEAAGAELFEHVDVFTLAFPNDRSQHHNPDALRQGHDLIDHLADGLRLELDAVFRTVWLAHAREQQTQVIVDFSDGADSRTRVM